MQVQTGSEAHQPVKDQFEDLLLEFYWRELTRSSFRIAKDRPLTPLAQVGPRSMPSLSHLYTFSCILSAVDFSPLSVLSSFCKARSLST